MEENNTRRHFLRNTVLTGFSLGLFPELTQAEEHEQTENSPVCDPTTLDYFGQGPFYKDGAPVIINNQLARPDEPGTRLILSGIVKTLDCSAVIPNATIDIWHANDAGQYDNAGYNLRGITYSNSQGFYLFETILPGKYLNGSSYRPRHIHFKITAPGFPTLITQLYFQGDPDNATDAAASITSGTYDASKRIIPLTMNGQKYEGTWVVVVDGTSTGRNDIYLDKGMIYSVSPNPFTDTIEINFGVFKYAKTTIQLFDLQGSQIAVLEEKYLEPKKYTIFWKLDIDFPSGVYFLSLKINDLQAHHIKMVRS